MLIGTYPGQRLLRCGLLCRRAFHTMIASVVQPVSRFGYSFAKTAIDTPLDTGPERLGEEDPPFHKKQEPAKSLEK